jgi:hypothetical protein
MRGVGKKTRDELIAVLDRLRHRFPEPARNGTTNGAQVEELGTPDLDALRSRLIVTKERIWLVYSRCIGRFSALQVRLISNRTGIAS